MLQAMCDLADALAALQQAVSMPVEALSGSWDWTLMHAAGAWAALLLGVTALADATAAHVLRPTPASAAALLAQVQGVQQQRYEFFALQRELRRLLHAALAAEPDVFAAFIDDSAGAPAQLPGQLRYASCVYATSKVLDRMTAVARCALDAYA
jgi:hypothetical protein